MKILKKSGILFLCLSLAFSLIFVSCNKKEADKENKTETAKDGEETKDEEIKPVSGDEVAYAFGVIVAKAVKQAKMDFNSKELAKGFNAAMAEDFDEAEFMNAEMTLQRAFQEAEMKMKAEKLKESEKFLAENKKKEGILVTESGLQYQILKKGDGTRKPTLTDMITVSYVGKLMDGKIFDSTKPDEPAKFTLDRVIEGWREGLQLMSKGAKYRFFIPPNLAYGAQGIVQGNTVIIPGNEVLTFEIELLDIELTASQSEEE